MRPTAHSGSVDSLRMLLLRRVRGSRKLLGGVGGSRLRRRRSCRRGRIGTSRRSCGWSRLGRGRRSRFGSGGRSRRRSGCSRRRGRGESRNRWRQPRRIIALQLEEDRRQLEWHFVAGIHVCVDLGVELMHLVVPGISLKPTAQGQGRTLAEIVPVQRGRHPHQIGHPRSAGSVGLVEQRVAELGSVERLQLLLPLDQLRVVEAGRRELVFVHGVLKA